jgi:predicted PurR-regulated permease PerM
MAGMVESKFLKAEPDRFSYFFMVALLAALVWLHLATLLLAGLFTYLALERLQIIRRAGKWLALAIFLVLLSGIAYGMGYFVKHTVQSLPEITERAVPSMIVWARQHGIELPFTDYDSLKDEVIDTVRSEVKYLESAAKFARGATTHLVLLIAGCVVAISVFFNPHFETGGPPQGLRTDLYARCCQAVAQRFGLFYQSFVRVMGAQVLISLINTLLTGIFILAVHLPYGVVVLGVTFLCGLLPVIGNLISNTIVVGIGFTVSPRMALIALVFLVLIHKLEYFLNSQIVGWRIRNPLWLTLIGLIVGERILGIPGIILAPVVLNYIRVEASAVPAAPVAEAETETEPELAERSK